VGCTETTIRTYSVTDACGNTISVTQNLIRTVDETAPTASNPAAITLNGCNGTFPAADSAVVTDEADACSTPVVAFVGDSAPALVGCTETTIRTYSVTDACGNTISVTQNLIRTVDTTAPTFVEALPINVTVQCSAVPAATTLTATDTCSGVTVTFTETSVARVCLGSYTLTRTWTAKNACGLTTEHTQTITVQDTTGPITTTEFSATIDVNCDAIPVKPELVFIDNCSTATLIKYTEEKINVVQSSYSIVRKWSVADACGNTSEFTQIINVTITNSIVTIARSACNADSSIINLNDLLPEGTPSNGSWITLNNIGRPQGSSSSTFSPFGVAIGDYVFEYKIDDATCPSSFKINMTVNADCGGIVLACGTVLVHNAFSPNGDGINEKFIIDNIDDTVCYPDNTVEIYNRWGVLVFETSNYNNTSKAFDGTSQGRATISQSSGLPTGTYFYILNYTSVDDNGNIITNKKDGYLYLTK
ncbi:gliding motility-associated C-terminal domain-containing protein, partial [Flavobacterium gawalongense]